MPVAEIYFQSCTGYFWQWEEDGQVAAIPGGNTIAYRELITRILTHTTVKGLPPFGAVLLFIIATNPQGVESLNKVHEIIVGTLGDSPDFYRPQLEEAIAFLTIVAGLPEHYKTGDKRLLLFHTLFESSHYQLSEKITRQIRSYLEIIPDDKKRVLPQIPADVTVYNKDFRTIGLLRKKFSNQQSIIENMAQVYELPETPKPETETPAAESSPGELVEQLIANTSTFHIGSLVKRIWNGLNIPVHSALPSQQPLGGFSDITNKGDFDKLLISEFANDDLAFLSRLANNEALYIQREVPPLNNRFHRVILLDTSLRNWGTPRIVAFATALAIARHPKTDIECHAFALGDTFQPVSFSSVDSIIDAQQYLSTGLHAAKGFEAFFTGRALKQDTEIFVFTTSETYKQPEMLRVMNEYKSAIHYWIHTDAEGNIDIYKKQLQSRRHIQHILLPLAALWNREKKAPEPGPAGERIAACNYPLLVRAQQGYKFLMTTSDGEIFLFTRDKSLLRRHDKSVPAYSKGWEVLYEQIPVSPHAAAMGLLTNGSHVLLLFSHAKREILLLNIENGSKLVIPLKDENFSPSTDFVYLDDHFYQLTHHYALRIDMQGRLLKGDPLDARLPARRALPAKEAEKYVHHTTGMFKNISSVFINADNQLLFNRHTLVQNHYGTEIVSSGSTKKLLEARKKSSGLFVFRDGSSVSITNDGIITLKSSDTTIPAIYIPSALDTTLGLVAGAHYTGNDFYLRSQQFEVHLEDTGPNKLSVLRIIKEKSGIGLKEAREKIDHSGQVRVAAYLSLADAVQMHHELVKLGATAIYGPMPNAVTVIPERLEPKVFYEKYINTFINTIRHATDS